MAKLFKISGSLEGQKRIRFGQIFKFVAAAVAIAIATGRFCAPKVWCHS